MEGLGESCTHIAAILFQAEIRVKCISSQTVIDKECYRLASKDFEKIVFQPTYKIDFTSAKTRERLTDQSFKNAPLNHSHSKKIK